MTAVIQNKMDITNLKKECQQWHSQLFGFDPSNAVLTHYENANLIYIEKMNPNELVILNTLLNHNLDLEALEYFWRFKNKKNLLTQKKMILLSICEIFPEYKDFYTNFRSTNLLKALFLLAYFTIRSIFKLVKGTIIYFKFVRMCLKSLKSRPQEGGD